MQRVRKWLKGSNSRVSVGETQNTGGLFTIIYTLKYKDKTLKKSIFWEAIFMTQACIVAPHQV